MEGYYFTTKEMQVGYQKNPLIKDIEIFLKKGEILTLIGPNGVGKSTVLKSIAKQLPLMAGGVYLDKEALAEMSREILAKKMAVVFTQRLKTEMMTCEDVVATGRYPYTGKFGLLSKSDYEVIEEAMELVQIKEFQNQDFTKISDGQKQRVMLARAICQEPEIIILDEPTSYLDIKYKLEFLSILQEMREKKKLTVIMSLHELELANKVSDKILCLNGEYVDRFGTPEEIFVQEYIRGLFDIKTGTFDEENGNMELAPPTGEATVFVIAGLGKGRAVYRKLQREGTAFVTGILFENDLDYPVAKALAKGLIAGKAFEPIEEAALIKAKKWMDSCETVVCCRETFGRIEEANQQLLEYAKERGKAIRWQK